MLPDRMRPAPSATDDLRAPKFPIEALWSEGETSEGPPKTEVRRLKLGEPAPGAMLLERAKLGVVEEEQRPTLAAFHAFGFTGPSQWLIKGES